MHGRAQKVAHRSYSSFHQPALAALVLLAIAAGCGGEETNKPLTQWPDGQVVPDAGLVIDGQANDLGVLPDFEVNPDGPKIEILAPKPAEVVVGELVKVQAKITDPDGIDDQTVFVTAKEQPPVKLAITATPGVYEGLIDVTRFSENVRIEVTAADMLGEANTVYLDFKRDPGPKVAINSPATDSRHKGSASVQIIVGSKTKITLFEARIGSVKLALKASDLGGGRTMHVGTIKFDDPVFSPPLSGQQVLTVIAENENKARVIVERMFFVDDEGPEITIKIQTPGQLIGAIIALEAQVTDPAGVVPSSVKCIIGNDLDKRAVLLRNTVAAPSTFTGQFDTRTLSQFDLWPVMSFRAADTLGNENHRDIQVGLDNGPPTIELDPDRVSGAGPAYGYHEGRKKDDALQCSHPFDPVGEDAASDQQLVPQVMPFRARIEDNGNHVPSAPWVPVSLVDPATARMYLLDDTTQPLVIDTTGDGFCDSVNPAVVPLGSAPAKGQAVAVDLQPIPPAGSADFTPWTFDPETEVPNGNVFPFLECGDGDSDKPPEPLCQSTVLTRVVPSPVAGGGVPAIYSIPPVAPGLQCVGLPFDFLANSFDDGWVCVVAEAADALGNGSVSRPIRVWVKKDALTAGPLPANAGSAPNCTGTLDSQSGKVDATKPCKFRTPADIFPQIFSSPELLVTE